jgi:hypothetical protein
LGGTPFALKGADFNLDVVDLVHGLGVDVDVDVDVYVVLDGGCPTRRFYVWDS